VENMSYFIPPDDPGKKYFIFGKSGCKKFAEELGIPLIGQIPIVPAIADSGDAGVPVALEENSPIADSFSQLAQAVAQQIAIHNAVRESFEHMN
jgi:ATP-binding protein involved in chromosome partitioning